MHDVVSVALITAGGSVLAAGIAAAGAYWLYCRKHADERKEKSQTNADNVVKALRYLMLYVIQERGKELIAQGYATLEERRSLHHWHDLYHSGLKGNGDANNLMEMVDALPISKGEQDA